LLADSLQGSSNVGRIGSSEASTFQEPVERPNNAGVVVNNEDQRRDLPTLHEKGLLILTRFISGRLLSQPIRLARAVLRCLSTSLLLSLVFSFRPRAATLI
jgi:hypothetical protein